MVAATKMRRGMRDDAIRRTWTMESVGGADVGLAVVVVAAAEVSCVRVRHHPARCG